jgi:adenosylmethionine-8-amino-7-oxononanoate aminotransferase
MATNILKKSMTGDRMIALSKKPQHPSVGAARSIGLFGLVELVRDQAKKVPMAPVEVFDRRPA